MSAQIPTSAAGTIQFDRCPACGYSLEGLPVEHRCPECGLEYDRRWHIFGDAFKGGWYSWLIANSRAAILPLIAIVCMLYVYHAHRKPWALGLAILFGALLIWMLTIRRQSWIALSPEGVHRYRRNKRTLTVAWRKCDFAEYRGEMLILISGSKRILVADWATFRFAPSELRECAEMIGALRTYYLNNESSAGK